MHRPQSSWQWTIGVKCALYFATALTTCHFQRNQRALTAAQTATGGEMFVGIAYCCLRWRTTTANSFCVHKNSPPEKRYGNDDVGGNGISWTLIVSFDWRLTVGTQSKQRFSLAENSNDTGRVRVRFVSLHRVSSVTTYFNIFGVTLSRGSR